MRARRSTSSRSELSWSGVGSLDPVQQRLVPGLQHRDRRSQFVCDVGDQIAPHLLIADPAVSAIWSSALASLPQLAGRLHGARRARWRWPLPIALVTEMMRAHRPGQAAGDRQAG